MKTTCRMLTALCPLFPSNHTTWRSQLSSPFPEEEAEAQNRGVLPQGHTASKWDPSPLYWNPCSFTLSQPRSYVIQLSDQGEVKRK